LAEKPERKKLKVKVTTEQATKDQMGSGGIALLFLNLGVRWGVGGQRQAPTALTRGKRAGTHFTRD